MLNIGTKFDSTPGATGELSAAEFNDHNVEIQGAVTQTGQTLAAINTTQLGKAMFIYGSGAPSMLDGAPSANIIQLTPRTGINGLQMFDTYSQADGVILEFNKLVANTSNSVVVNVGQTAGTLLGAKSLKLMDGSDPLISQVVGYNRIIFDVGSDYWVLLPKDIETGFIQTELVTSGTNLLVKRPKIAIEATIGTRYTVDNIADTTIDLTALLASTWYALCCREDTGVISAQAISVFASGGGGNWDISGNQLDIYDEIWDSDRKYCRAYDATNYYRVFGVFKTNSTPNGLLIQNDNEMLVRIDNLPKAQIIVGLSATSIASDVTTVLNFDDVKLDINSEWDTTTKKMLPVKSANIIASVNVTDDVVGLAGATNRAIRLFGRVNLYGAASSSNDTRIADTSIKKIYPNPITDLDCKISMLGGAGTGVCGVGVLEIIEV